MNKTEILDSIGTVLVILAVVAVLASGVMIVSDWNNDRHEAECVAKGGEYYRANLSGRSLCHRPSKG